MIGEKKEKGDQALGSLLPGANRDSPSSGRSSVSRYLKYRGTSIRVCQTLRLFLADPNT